MPSLINRPNGFQVPALSGTRGNILIKTQSEAYSHYVELRADDKVVMDTLLYICSTNTNHMLIAGDTLATVVEKSGYSKGTILNCLTRLNEINLISALVLPYEYIVNPLFAIKGSEYEVWKFLQTTHYKGEVPREVLLTSEELVLTTNY